MEGRMLDIEVKAELHKLGIICQIAQTINTAGLLKEFGWNDSVGVLLDPTGWMKIRDNAEKNERAVRALAIFNAEILKVWPEFASYAPETP